MYSGMADVAALTGDQAYVHAIDKNLGKTSRWGKKLYITGGIGATSSGEAFWKELRELPNMTAYNENLRSRRQRISGITGSFFCTPTRNIST